eukprot:6193513-Pleurochrysis_carterae.AAC.3
MGPRKRTGNGQEGRSNPISVDCWEEKKIGKRQSDARHVPQTRRINRRSITREKGVSAEPVGQERAGAPQHKRALGGGAKHFLADTGTLHADGQRRRPLALPDEALHNEQER